MYCFLICLIFFGYTNSAKSQENKKLEFAYPLKSYRPYFGFEEKNPDFGNLYHCAQDVYGDAGTAVFSIADGEIVYSGPMNGYGYLIIIEHQLDSNQTIYSLYGHLSTRREKLGLKSVKRGDFIAFIGDADENGGAWYPHLHFAIRKGKKSDYSDRNDDRWMAGYTKKLPSEMNWIDPGEFLRKYIQMVR